MSPGAREAAGVAAGAAAHLVLLCVPFALAGDPGGALGQPRVALCLALLIAWSVAEALAQPVRARPAAASHPRLPPLHGALILAALWASLLEAALAPPAPPGAAAFGGVAAPGGPAALAAAAALAGAAALAAGIALRLAAIRALGAWFLDEIALAPGQPLVTRGIYGRLRHPSEAGTLLIVYGAALLLGSPAGAAAATLLLLPVLLRRTRLEDALLAARHPAAFAAYARGVPGLVPRLRPAPGGEGCARSPAAS